MKVRIEFHATVNSSGDTEIDLYAFNANDYSERPSALAHASGASIREASLALISKYKAMQDATITALSSSGLARFVDVDVADKAAGELS